MEIIYQGQKIIVDVIYSQRKTFSIAIKEDGKVVVRSPRGVSTTQIENILMKKGNWILEKQNQVLKKRAVHKRRYEDGELFLYKGTAYPLHIDVDPAYVRAHVRFLDDCFYIGTPIEDKALYSSLMESFYRQMTEVLVRERVAYYKPIIGVTPNRIVIKQQKTRWGSCSSLGNLNFNWKLSMAIPDALDYVVLHEMCHLIHLNHSKAFWELVERIKPDYRIAKDWLKSHIQEMQLD